MPAVIWWTPAMSVGVEALDTDHKMLIGPINQLEDAIAISATPMPAASGTESSDACSISCATGLPGTFWGKT